MPGGRSATRCAAPDVVRGGQTACLGPARLSLFSALCCTLIAASTSSTLAAEDPSAVELFQSGKYAECVAASAKAIGADESGTSRLPLGAALNHRLLKIRAELELGQYADAGQTLAAGLKRHPESIELRWLGREVARFENQPERAKQYEEEIVQLVEKTPWQYSVAGSRLIVGKLLLSQGSDPKKVLGMFNETRRQVPSFAESHLAAGELALEKSDYALAAQSFQQAIKLNEADPDAHFGLARAFEPSDPEKCQASLKAALERNPHHIKSLLFLVEDQIDSERYAEAETLLLHVAAVNPQHPRAAAYRAVIAHLQNQPERETQLRDAALAHWRTNPEVDHLIGKKLSQKYRFAEGAEHQRQALLFDKTYLPARMQLAQDLLRLGEEEEGWKLADEVYKVDGYNIAAHNLELLHDSLEKFRTLEAEGIVLRMDAREADLYGGRVLDLLKRAKRTLCAKYDVQLDKPIIVEMFPRQQDFAIRTFGMPGGAGFLGVCFGTVITANSPASQGDSPSCWEATLWHEFCHVVTLNKTHNRMPRWLSEGISVYEERQADPAWGQSINPRYRQMLLGDDLTPVSELSGAFLRPASAVHLQFAYFESSLVVEYLIDKHGLPALKEILVDLGQGITINDALERHAGSLEELNAGFAQFARTQAESMAPQAEWSEPELPKRADAATLSAWVKMHPTNYLGQQRLARQLVTDKQWSAAKVPLEAMRKLYPQDASADGLYPLLAKVHRELKESPEERSALDALVKLTDDNVDALSRLVELSADAGDWEASKRYALRWLAVNPLQPAPHRAAAHAAEKLNDDALLIEGYTALLHLDPVDLAEIHWKLATAQERTGNLDSARRHILLSLEEAPRFRAAHARLLEIVKQIAARDAEKDAPPAKSPPVPGTSK